MKVLLGKSGTFETIRLSFEGRVWSKTSLPSIAATANYLGTDRQCSNTKLIFDFSETYWVEVPTLLALATLANQVNEADEVVLIFTSVALTEPVQTDTQSSGLEQKLKFLSFLRSMGFFLALPQQARIETTRGVDRVYSPLDFERLLSNIPVQPFIQAITLTPIQVLNTNDFLLEGTNDKIDSIKLKISLKAIGENAALNIASAGLHKGTIRRQRILLSVDKILQECLANVIEHAYNNSGLGGNFAFFARIRNPNSTFDGEFRDGLYESSDEYDHSRDVNWTELYVCDLGMGIETQIDSWLETEKEKGSKGTTLITDLKKASKSENKFLHASRLLFDHSLSRHVSRDYARSPQTGLQDIKRVLSDVGYVDITNCLSVNRRRFDANSNSDKPNLRKLFSEHKTLQLVNEVQKKEILEQFPSKGAGISLTAGTHLIFRTQFSSEIPTNGQPGYKDISRKQANQILQIYNDDSSFADDSAYFDKRFSNSSQPTSEDLSQLVRMVERRGRKSRLTILVRLSRNPYKNDVNEWLQINGHEVHGNRLSEALSKKQITIELHFVDVLPVYAGWLVNRIKGYANSSWIMKSEMMQVGIFTNMFHFVIFERNESGYRIARSNTSAHTKTILSVARALRKMDSKAFWKSYENHPISDVYLNENIEWIVTRRKLGEVFKNEYPIIWGFLDFATSLQCIERYRVCERALLRFMAILYKLNEPSPVKGLKNSKMFMPSLVSSDTMTQRLAGSVQSLFEEIAEFNEASILVLSSIVVSGQTQERAVIPHHHKNTGHHEVKVNFFNRIGNNRKGRGHGFSLLRWSPPAPINVNRTKPHKRIFRTAEVSAHGSLDIKIPHITSKHGQPIENYQRDRTKTYADFELLGALQFGHFEKSNRHELININLNALVPLIISTNHPSWRWLISAFFEPQRDANYGVIVIYPNQPHAEQIIQEVKHREADKVPSDRVRFISAPFLKSRKSEPILVSPRLSHRLAALIRDIKEKQTGADRDSSKGIVIRIFDAGVVTGRTIRALEQQVQSVLETQKGLGEKDFPSVKFETISLLDRSGYPIYGVLLDKYSEQNKRFWRWDVPSLTENGICRICLGKQRIVDWNKRSAKFVGSQYISELYASTPNLTTDHTVGSHHSPDSIDLWPDNLSGIDLARLPVEFQQVIFGYYNQEPNIVYLASPQQYISTFAELTRLLHRSDIALNRAMELSIYDDTDKSNIDCLVVLLLASHILLFYETFDDFERINYAVELFGCLLDYDADWGERNVRSLANTYGILALYSLDEDILEVLRGPSYFCYWLTKKRLTNPYLKNFIHDISLDGNAFPTVTNMTNRETTVWRDNVNTLREGASIVVGRIMDIVGDQRIWHKSAIYQRLAESGVTHAVIQQYFGKLRYLLGEATDLGIYYPPNNVLSDVTQQSKKEAVESLTGTERTQLMDLLGKGAGSLREKLFESIVYLGPPTGTMPSWSSRRIIKKIFSLTLSEHTNDHKAFLKQLNTGLKNTANRGVVTDLYAYFGLGKTNDNLPFDGCISFAPSFAAKSVVEHALLNTRHSLKSIFPPANIKTSVQGKRYAWVWIKREQDALCLYIANHCEKNPNCDDLYQERFPSLVSEGNSAECYFDSSLKTLTTKIKFNTLVRR